MKNNYYGSERTKQNKTIHDTRSSLCFRFYVDYKLKITYSTLKGLHLYIVKFLYS